MLMAAGEEQRQLPSYLQCEKVFKGSLPQQCCSLTLGLWAASGGVFSCQCTRSIRVGACMEGWKQEQRPGGVSEVWLEQISTVHA